MRRIILVAVIVISAVLVGCPGTPPATPAIEDIGWYFENIATDFWSDSPSTTAFATFFLNLADTGVTRADLLYVEATNGGLTWRWEDTNIRYDEENRVVTLSRLWSPSWPSHSIQLTGWDFGVYLRNGLADTEGRDFPGPGTTSLAASAPSCYTENYFGSTTGMDAMIERAVVTDATSDGSLLTVSFAYTGRDSYNCWLWLYDAGDNYLGYAAPGLDWATGASDLLATGTIKEDGQLNTLEVQAPDITFFDPAYTFADVQQVRVIVTDGLQYQSEGSWDFRSVSSIAPVS